MKDTLCWTCAVPGTGGCSWDLELKPVEGWGAEPTRLRQNGGWTRSYHVNSCPLFRPMELVGRQAEAVWGTIPADTVFGLMFTAGMNDSEISMRTGVPARVVHRRRVLWMRTKGEGPERDW